MTAPLAVLEASPWFGTREKVFLGLWAALSVLYWMQYRRSERVLGTVGKVGGLLAFIWGLTRGFDWMAQVVPADQVISLGDPPTEPGSRVPLAADVVLAGVGLLLLAVAWHARRKFSTVVALLLSTWDRGHWYMLPVLFILMTLGLLLVAAAASPVLSPFIYTLF